MVKNLNLLPDMITSKVITTEEGVKELASFIYINYKIFGLQKYDEDFRNDIIVSILEKGDSLFSNFKPECGDFFNYVYYFINSKVISNLKKQSKNILDEKFTFQEAVSSYNEKCTKYEEINLYNSMLKKIPYRSNKISIENLKEGIKNSKLEEYDKSIFFLALKACYDLDDSQIVKIAQVYNLKIDLFYDLIQYLREIVLVKKERLDDCIERRNVKYYKHRKYMELIDYLDSSDSENSEFRKSDIIKKDNIQVKNLTKSNEKFESGFIYLRPPTRILAEICNISERQINYYLQCLKKEKIDPKLMKRIKNLLK